MNGTGVIIKQIQERQTTMFVKRCVMAVALLTLAASLWAAASIVGAWDITTVDPNGNPLRGRLTTREDGGKLVGGVTVEDLALAMSDASMSGDTFTCKVTHEGRAYEIKLKVVGDTLEGAWQSAGGPKGNIKGKRSKS